MELVCVVESSSSSLTGPVSSLRSAPAAEHKRGFCNKRTVRSTQIILPANRDISTQYSNKEKGDHVNCHGQYRQQSLPATEQMDRLHQVFSMTKYFAFINTSIMLSSCFATLREKRGFKNLNMAGKSPTPLWLPAKTTWRSICWYSLLAWTPLQVVFLVSKSTRSGCMQCFILQSGDFRGHSHLHRLVLPVHSHCAGDWRCERWTTIQSLTWASKKSD